MNNYLFMYSLGFNLYYSFCLELPLGIRSVETLHPVQVLTRLARII